MPFVPSAAAQALVQQSAAQLHQRRWAAAADRRRLMALTNARRCSMQPLYGEDLLWAVHVDLPVHHVNFIKDRVRVLKNEEALALGGSCEFPRRRDGLGEVGCATSTRICHS